MGEPESDNVLYLKPRDQVVAEIQEWIIEAGMRAGDRLPSVRELARSLRVSAGRLRQALGVLTAMGVVEPMAAGHELLGSEPAPVLDTLLRLRMSLAGFTRSDLMSTRLQLESAAAARAATDATPADLDHLWCTAEAMTRTAINPSHFSELDCEFHLRLARAGHNNLAALLLCVLGDAMKIEMRTGYRRGSDWRATSRRLAAEHRSIAHAVERRDPDRAAVAVTRHIAGFYNLRAS